jgi:hypothetical protein
LYINSTPQGIFSFNLLKILPIWEINYLNPATTQFTNTNRIAKEVTYLQIKLAEQL